MKTNKVRPGIMAAIIGFSALILAGCRTAPDMQPFADATSQLSSSIKTAGRTVVSEVDTMSSRWDNTRRKNAEKIIEDFGRQWEKRQKLADALVEYSASLAAIAEAGEQGEKSAQAVAFSFQKLTDAVGVAFPQTRAGDMVVNLGSYLYGKFAKDHAARTLGESMNRLQPVINETASIVSDSFKDIEDGLDAVRAQNDQNTEDEVVEGDSTKVRTLRNRLKHLLERRAELLGALKTGDARRDSLRDRLLNVDVAQSIASLRTADTNGHDKLNKLIEDTKDKETELARLTKLMADIAAELAVIESTIKLESDTLKPIDARKADDYVRLSAAINLVRLARGGLNDWAVAHSRLATAALEKKTPQVEELIQTASEIRDLIKTVRAGQNH
jgi:hypothetical protein